MEGPSRGRAALAWMMALAVTAAIIALTHFTSRDNDSFLYAGLSAKLSQLPVAQWIAPDWWGFWTLHGPYCEHPVGLFILPAALGRLGYPAEQAAYAVNAFWQVGSLVLASLIAAFVVAPRDARALAWILQLLPIAFVFRVRANHEYAVLACVLFAVYCTERARSRAAWTAGMVAAFVAVLLVKGVFAFIVPVACALWLVARAGAWSDLRRAWPAWAAIAVMPVAGALVTWAYEAAYFSVTGRSFLQVYRNRQVPEGALTAGSPVVRAAYSAVWYAARVMWYAFPWSLFAAALAVRGVRGGWVWPWNGKAGALPQTSPSNGSLFQGAWFAIATGLLLLAAFSLAHRKADRYIFVVYFLMAAAGAVAALRRHALAAAAGRASRSPLGAGGTLRDALPAAPRQPQCSSRVHLLALLITYAYRHRTRARPGRGLPEDRGRLPPRLARHRVVAPEDGRPERQSPARTRGRPRRPLRRGPRRRRDVRRWSRTGQPEQHGRGGARERCARRPHVLHRLRRDRAGSASSSSRSGATSGRTAARAACALPSPDAWEDRTRSVMAGGDYALIKSVEGFEDFAPFGRKQIGDLGVRAGDMVFAITEGGETSFVIGTAWQGVERGARVFFVYNNPDDVLRAHVRRSREVIDDPRIEKVNLTTGPMAITGSTRMQATSIELLALLTVLEMVLRELLGRAGADARRSRPAADAPAEMRDGARRAARASCSSAGGLRAARAARRDRGARLSRRRARTSYFADALAVDVLTDTTERSPTFCTPSFRKWDDAEASESWAFLFTPEPTTEAAGAAPAPRAADDRVDRAGLCALCSTRRRPSARRGPAARSAGAS